MHPILRFTSFTGPPLFFHFGKKLPPAQRMKRTRSGSKNPFCAGCSSGTPMATMATGTLFPPSAAAHGVRARLRGEAAAPAAAVAERRRLQQDVFDRGGAVLRPELKVGLQFRPPAHHDGERGGGEHPAGGVGGHQRGLCLLALRDKKLPRAAVDGAGRAHRGFEQQLEVFGRDLDPFLEFAHAAARADRFRAAIRSSSGQSIFSLIIGAKAGAVNFCGRIFRCCPPNG